MNAKWCGAAARPTASSSSNRSDRLHGGLARRRLRFQRGSNLARGLQCTANERVLGIAVERQQAIAMLAIDLIAVAHLVGLVAKHARAARTLDPHLVIDHHPAPARSHHDDTTRLAKPLSRCRAFDRKV